MGNNQVITHFSLLFKLFFYICGMKKSIIIKSLVVLLIIMGFTKLNYKEKVTNIQVTVSPLHVLPTLPPIEIVKYNPITIFNRYDDFINHIGFMESTNDYTKVNTIGYIGRYQFGKSTLKTLKYKGSINKFLNSPKLQDEYMLKNLKYNKKRLQKYIDKYEGTIIKGVEISESGILAAAHLGGVNSVKRYFKHGKNPKDKYGTSISNYLTKFSGYNLNLK